MTDLLHFFPGQGFRPAIYLNDYIGPRLDCPLIVPAPDADIAMIAKFDPYAHLPAPTYTWGTWIPAPVTDAPQITAASLAGPVTTPAVWHPVTPSQPWWPSEPNWPQWPCCIIIEPDSPDMPPVAPVPLEASALFLLTAVVALAWLRRRA